MPYSTRDIRNVCLVGPSHAGKTLLTEALLHAGGKIPEKGSIEKGTTVSDYTAREKEIGHSQFNSVCHLDHEGIHVNLIDTPGYRDFYGRALSVMPAAETAAIVINANEGVEMIARRMMDAAKRQRMCRMIVINKIDAEGVNLEKVFNDIQEAFGKECLPMNLPSKDGSKVVDCFFQLEGDETAFSSVADAHTQIVDQVVEVDEKLMELYLEQGEELEASQLLRSRRDRLVLDRAHDDPPAPPLPSRRVRRTQHRQVVGLRPATGDDDLARTAPQGGRDLLAGVLECRLGPAGHRVDPRRVAEHLIEERLHGRPDLGPHRRGRRVVEIGDVAHGSPADSDGIGAVYGGARRPRPRRNPGRPPDVVRLPAVTPGHNCHTPRRYS